MRLMRQSVGPAPDVVPLGEPPPVARDPFHRSASRTHYARDQPRTAEPLGAPLLPLGQMYLSDSYDLPRALPVTRSSAGAQEGVSLCVGSDVADRPPSRRRLSPPLQMKPPTP